MLIPWSRRPLKILSDVLILNRVRVLYKLIITPLVLQILSSETRRIIPMLLVHGQFLVCEWCLKCGVGRGLAGACVTVVAVAA